MKKVKILFVALILGALLPCPLFAQNVHGTLSGLVNDSTGAPIVNAAIKLSLTERQFIREVTTDGNGQFRLTALPPGLYDIEVAQTGFTTLRREKALQVLAGDSLYQTVTLQTGSVSEMVTVAGTLDEIAKVRVAANRGGTFGEAENTDLPMLAGGQARSFRTQAYLLPGVTPSAGRSASAHAPFVINGLRPNNTVNVMVDGADFNNPVSGTLNGNGINEQPVSQEVLATTEVQTNNYKAEYGRAAGGTINLVTLSGGNQWHGKLYNFLQNDALNAANPIFGAKRVIKRNNAGLFLSGPIIKDRLFFSLNGEAIVDRSSRQSNAQFTFTEAERARAVPQVRALLALYPQPNRPVVAGRPAEFNPTGQITRDGGHFYFGRLDYVLNQQHLINYRYSKASSQPVNLFQNFGQQASFVNENVNNSLAWTYNIRPNLTNEARAYYVRKYTDSTPGVPRLGDPALNGVVGFVTVVGAERLGTFFRDFSMLHNYQFSDDVSWSRGSHGLKGGIVGRFVQNNSNSNLNPDGILVFTSRDSFLAGRPISYTRAFGDTRLDQRQKEFALYAQDDWRVRPNLQINYGVRYELYTPPADKYGRIPINYDTDKNNIAPRFGFAWTPGKQTNLVVRGGYGMFYTPLPMRYIGDARFNPPRVQTFSFTYFNLPPTVSPLSNLEGGIRTLNSNRTITSPDIVQPYAQQFNLTFDYRLFSSDSILSVAYVGTRASHLGITRLPNGGSSWPTTIPNPAGGQPLPNPRPLATAIAPDGQAYGNGVVTVLESSASSNYNSLQISLQGRLAKGLNIRSAYTFSKAIDDISADSLNFVDENRRRLDRAISDFNIPHSFTTSLMYALPFDDRLPGAVRPFLSGWQTSTIVTLRSGLPFSILSGTPTPYGSAVNRINDVPGTILRNVGSFRALQPADGITLATLPARVVTGFVNTSTPTPIGTLGRNTEVGDHYYDVSFGLHKNISFTERLKSQFRIEVFNLFNTVNFDSYVNSIANPAFGQATSVYGQRTMQMVLRLTF